MRQKAFTKEYAEELEFNIESNLSKYGSDSFEYNTKAVVDLPYEVHEGLLEEMMPYLSTEAKVEVDAAGCLTGRFATPNCYGPEKVRRIEAVWPHREQYDVSAFGDSRGDKEMLAYADQAYFKPFRF